jgi:hypothetical protein
MIELLARPTSVEAGDSVPSEAVPRSRRDRERLTPRAVIPAGGAVTIPLLTSDALCRTPGTNGQLQRTHSLTCPSRIAPKRTG